MNNPRTIGLKQGPSSVPVWRHYLLVFVYTVLISSLVGWGMYREGRSGCELQGKDIEVYELNRSGKIRDEVDTLIPDTSDPDFFDKLREIGR